MAPAPNGGNNFVGIGDPLERLGLGVAVVEEAVDRRLKVNDRLEDAALQTTLGQDGEDPSTALESPSGFKCQVQFARVALSKLRRS